MNKKINEIEILEQDVLSTVYLCSEELDEVLSNQESKVSMLVQLFKFDIKRYMIFSIVGFVVSMFFVLFIPSSRMLSAAIYFGLLGGIGIYETYLAQTYRMSEMVKTSYINEGRLFLYKCIVISIIQLGLFMILVAAESVFQSQFEYLILSTIIPLLLSQMLCLIFERWIRNGIYTFSLFVLIYMVYEMVLFSYYNEILAYLSVDIILVCVVVCLIGYVVSIIVSYFNFTNKRVEVLMWN